MTGIEAALQGTLGRDPELRTSQAGKPWAKLAVAVPSSSNGQDSDAPTWVQVACFGEVAERICSQAHKGSKIYAEGQLKQTEWVSKTTGEKKVGLEVAAWRVQVLGSGAIGHNKVAKKPKAETQQHANNGQAAASRDWQRPLDAEIPFAPEWRG
jgi:single stranded DNA-binding protein